MESQKTTARSNKMKIKIYCTTKTKGTHSFYIKKDGTDYYLFSQDYRRGVQEYFGRSVSFDEAIDFSRAKKDNAILHTMEKLSLYSKYIERQYGIAICKKSICRRPKTFDRRAYA